MTTDAQEADHPRLDEHPSGAHPEEREVDRAAEESRQQDQRNRGAVWTQALERVREHAKLEQQHQRDKNRDQDHEEGRGHRPEDEGAAGSPSRPITVWVAQANRDDRT